MLDILAPVRRSKMMSNIRSKNTEPELTLRRALHARGYRYLLHRRDLPGSLELVFPKYRWIVFVHGCFLHHHVGRAKATLPKTRIGAWKKRSTIIYRVIDERSWSFRKQSGKRWFNGSASWRRCPLL